MSLIEPAGTPPTITWLPLTSWDALSKLPVTVYLSPPPSSMRAATSTAPASATMAAIRPTADDLDTSPEYPLAGCRSYGDLPAGETTSRFQRLSKHNRRLKTAIQRGLRPPSV